MGAGNLCTFFFGLFRALVIARLLVHQGLDDLRGATRVRPPFVRFITSPTNEPIARVRPPRYAASSGIDATPAAHVASTPRGPRPPGPAGPADPAVRRLPVPAEELRRDLRDRPESPEIIAARTDSPSSR